MTGRTTHGGAAREGGSRRSSPFTEAYFAMLADGSTVRVADQEGRPGRVVTIDPTAAEVVFENGGCVSYSAERFDARLRIVRIVPPRAER